MYLQKMANIILIPNGEKKDPAWYDWISTELVKRGHSFFYPEFPSKQEELEAWMNALKDYRKHLDESSIIISHGSGRIIALKILEEKLREITGAFFVSDKNLNKDFNSFIKELDFSIIKDKTKNFFVYSSEEDDQETLKDSEELANKLGDEVQIMDTQKNFKDLENFEDLLIDVLSLIKS